jgi:hypothetical protein
MCYGTSGAEDTGKGGAVRGARGGTGAARAGAPRVRRRRTLAFGIEAARLEELAREAASMRAAHEAERARRIAELRERAVADGGETDPFYWTLVYDLEMAPSTTGRGMLLEHRIVPVPPQDLAEDDDLHDELWTVIEGLAASGVFLLNTDHLSDRDLYARLYYRILDEPTRALPPESEAAEYIDCLHPMDLEAGIAGRALADRLSFGSTSAGETSGKRGRGVRAPYFAHSPADRDRWLPMPGA